MRSINDFIARPLGGKRYNNSIDIDGIELITSVSEEDHKSTNREAKVVSVPINYSGDVQPGDILLCHHNTFKIYNDIKGRRKSGRSFFRDDTFFIEPDQFFAYKRDGEWKAHGRYCFVSPVLSEGDDMYRGKYESLIGVMDIPNDKLISRGVNKGDRVVFKPDSEYEFMVDGRLMYRMFDHQITVVLK